MFRCSVKYVRKCVAPNNIWSPPLPMATVPCRWSLCGSKSSNRCTSNHTLAAERQKIYTEYAIHVQRIGENSPDWQESFDTNWDIYR